MPVIRKFMCCWQLTTGAVVIGCVGLGLQIVLLARTSFILANHDIMHYEELGATAERTTLITLLVSHIISIVSHICLLWGELVKNRFFLLPWLIITMLTIVPTFFTSLILAFALASTSENNGLGALIFIVGLLITGIILYLWLCVLSLFQELGENTDDGHLQNTAAVPV